VADVLRPNPQTVDRTAPLESIGRAFARSQTLHLYVVDAQGRLEGAISLVDIQDYLEESYPQTLVTAFDLLHTGLPVLTPQMHLPQAATAFLGHRGERLPVVEDTRNWRLLGSVSKTDLLLTLAHGTLPEGT
jgi:CIC family chloride channel protein